MTKIGKKLAAVLLAVAMVVTFVPVFGTQTAHAAESIQPSGSCGTKTGSGYADNATYTYQPGDGLLTISGTGEIGSRAFADYTNKANVKHIVISDGITFISPNAFEGLTGVEDVLLPSGLKTISEYAFYNCFKLNQITLPDTLEEIDTQAFFNDGISEIDIPESMRKLNWDAFGAANEDYGKLEKVIMRSTDIEFTERKINQFPNAITSAGPIGGDYDYQFAWTQKIPDQAFAYLKEEDNTCMLSSVTLPDTITEIGSSAFSGAYNLTDVVLPAGLKTIGVYAFYGTGLVNVSLPSSVTEVGKEAFNCDSLDKVTILNPRCEIYDEFSSGNTFGSGAAIAGYDNSTAEAFAEQYGYIFESLGSAAINTIDVGNVWKYLDPVNAVPFTGEVHDELDTDGINFNEKMEITEEGWTSDGQRDIKKSASGVPTIGYRYMHNLWLKAKEGWTFADGDSITIVYGGTTLTELMPVISADKKTAWIAGLEYVTIDPINLSSATIAGITDRTYTGKALTQSPTVKMNVNGTAVTLKSGTDYTIHYNNNVKVGSAAVIITGKGNYTGTITKTFKISKAANPLKVSAKTATVKYSNLKKKTQTLAVTKVIQFTKKTNDKKTYTLVSAKKGSKSFKKYFKINKTTGKVTIKKNSKMKNGTYQIKVKVKAAGNANYKASAWKTVTFKVKIK